jgi:hypothetical protein
MTRTCEGLSGSGIGSGAARRRWPRGSPAHLRAVVPCRQSQSSVAFAWGSPWHPATFTAVAPWQPARLAARSDRSAARSARAAVLPATRDACRWANVERCRPWQPAEASATCGASSASPWQPTAAFSPWQPARELVDAGAPASREPQTASSATIDKITRVNIGTMRSLSVEGKPNRRRGAPADRQRA